jgi:hypothetical protein
MSFARGKPDAAASRFSTGLPGLPVEAGIARSEPETAFSGEAICGYEAGAFSK